ncbi:branched-chain amino acid ABC transporter permease [Actinomadura sp. 7K507]|nr:branched-chain amino acid ABC transporter permease [Actinomadura sp. 7K507]
MLVTPAAFAAEGETLAGTVRGPDRNPVADIVIMVKQGDKEVGEATTGADGTWSVELPGPGRYDVSLDVQSLPQGVVMRNKGGESLTDISVTEGQEKNVLFPLAAPGQAGGGADGGPGGPQADTGPGTGERFLQLLLEGVRFGAIIAITSVGLSLIFGTTRLVNFAHGEMVTLGAVIAWFLNVQGPGWQLLPAAALAVVAGVGIGGAIERGIWRPLRRRGVALIQMFIVSIGLALLLRHGIQVWFGATAQPYNDYQIQDRLTWGPLSITPRDLAIIGISFAVLFLVGLGLQRTRIGKAMRAVSDNRDLAESSGIDVSRVILYVWMLAGGLAALGGVFYGVSENVSFNMGFRLLLLMFASVILGGLGTAYGAIAGSLVVGIVAQVSTLWLPVELQNAWALVVLILVLLFRPQGILGRSERVG